MITLKKLTDRFGQGLHLYLTNTAWMVGDKVLRLGAAMLVSILVARHLGPEDFGILSYSLSLATLFGVAGHMGLVGLVVRDLVAEPEHRSQILGTTLTLKSAGVLVGFVLLMITIFLTEPVGSTSFWVATVAGLMLLSKPANILDFWFQARVQARYSAIAHVTSVALIAGLKVGLVLLGVGVVYFAFADLLQAFLSGALLLLLYARTAGVRIREWTFDKRRARDLLGRGSLVFMGALFALLYFKIDQVMLRWLAGPSDVGIYAVAATLSEGWYFIPTAIVSSIFPPMIRMHQKRPERFRLNFQRLLDLLFLSAAVVALAMTFLSDALILVLYGAEYSGAAAILAIHVWAGTFMSLRAAFSKWILIENVLVFSALTQGMGALANVLLNLWLIPVLGGEGAAYATILSYAVASYLSLAFYKKTRDVFVMMTLSFLAPVRLPLQAIRRSG